MNNSPDEKEFSEKESIRRLEEILPGLESLLENRVQHSRLTQELSEYIADLKKENHVVSKIRTRLIFGASALIIALWGFLLSSLTCNFGHWGSIDTYARVAFIVGLFAFTGVFIVIALRGSFRMARDRHGEHIPEHLKPLIEAVRMSGSGEV